MNIGHLVTNYRVASGSLSGALRRVFCGASVNADIADSVDSANSAKRDALVAALCVASAGTASCVAASCVVASTDLLSRCSFFNKYIYLSHNSKTLVTDLLSVSCAGGGAF